MLLLHYQCNSGQLTQRRPLTQIEQTHRSFKKNLIIHIASIALWVYMKAVVPSDNMVNDAAMLQEQNLQKTNKCNNHQMLKTAQQLTLPITHLYTDGLKCCKCCPVSFFFVRSLWLSDTLILVLILSNFYA